MYVAPTLFGFCARMRVEWPFLVAAVAPQKVSKPP